jgi:hypothetical protein
MKNLFEIALLLVCCVLAIRNYILSKRLNAYKEKEDREWKNTVQDMKQIHKGYSSEGIEIPTLFSYAK